MPFNLSICEKSLLLGFTGIILSRSNDIKYRCPLIVRTLNISNIFSLLDMPKEEIGMTLWLLFRLFSSLNTSIHASALSDKSFHEEDNLIIFRLIAELLSLSPKIKLSIRSANSVAQARERMPLRYILTAFLLGRPVSTSNANSDKTLGVSSSNSSPYLIIFAMPFKNQGSSYE